ncbi:Tyrosine-protein phosphatase non-receptor type 14 [Orchesella cincta]|uniref:protein-tyrosine-phosphatase n=1 Tax=Orchesella cincta TaxID=48709 RepID=A0A1D2N3E6_ORCCI|nr:Tyrosine-protein phosphatase non-receptor type 14 [Orchesella cincta]
MPLKILKRTSKQYNVVSKSTFVISVELLDNGIMECTLDADSTGRDCLLNISQRLGLHQPEFFGLRYISRGVPPRQRWVELDKPLKKQLEKNAQDSQLSLGVIFYVSDVTVLKDEMTRYHYFLQLKSDIIDGKLNCNIEQAISLAAYSLQAEFGDYDPERHTVEYLRDFAILPKDLTSGQKFPDINIDVLYEAVARQYGSLIGFPPPLSEIYYIMVAQQLDGYGQEAYPAKDDSGNDVLICVSANGLVIRRRDWTHIAAFRWTDVKSIVGHKRSFVIETVQSQRPVQFQFSDAEVAKYVRKMCILQEKFFKDHIASCSENMRTVSNGTYTITQPDTMEGAQPSSSAASSQMVGLRATPDLIAPSLARSVAGSQYSLNSSAVNSNLLNGRNLSSSGLNLHLLQQQLHQTQAAIAATNSHCVNPSLQELSAACGGTSSNLVHNGSIGTVSSLAETSIVNAIHSAHLPNVASSSLTNVGSLPLQINVANNVDHGQLKALLPAYRQAPDYNTAVQIKYGGPVIQSLPVGDASQEALYENQRKVSIDQDEPIYQNEIVSQIHSLELRDSQISSAPEPVVAVPNASPPEENVYIFKPPPPYPGNGASGSSSSSNLDISKKHVSSENTPGLTKDHSHSQSIKMGTSLSRVPPSDMQAVKSVSAVSIVSAEVHKAPLGRDTNCSSMENTSSVSISAKSTSSLPKTNGLLKEGNGMRKSSANVVQNENKPGHLFGKPIDPNILREFQAIPKVKSNANFATALRRENAKRNRCPEVLPYEDNTVRLHPTRANPLGFVNASPLMAHISGRDWKYMVGQIPLPGNAPAVWQLIWEANIKIIAVLERDSSALFYPENGSSIPLNDFQVVESKAERRGSASIAREYNLVYLPKKKQRKVWILPYEDEWKDDVPVHTEHFLCFLEEVNSIQRKLNDTSPLLVLCGTGAGRSGVLILADLLLHAADSGHKLRCDTLLNELRTQRMALVSTPSQYAFVLHTLAEYLARSRLI